MQIGYRKMAAFSQGMSSGIAMDTATATKNYNKGYALYMKWSASKSPGDIDSMIKIFTDILENYAAVDTITRSSQHILKTIFEFRHNQTKAVDCLQEIMSRREANGHPSLSAPPPNPENDPLLWPGF